MRRISAGVALCGVALVGVFVLLWDRVLWHATTPRDPAGDEVTLVVPAGLKGEGVYELLCTVGLARHAALARGYVRHVRRPLDPVPGEYRLSPGSSLVQLLDIIEAGRVVTHTVVLRPGWTAERMGDVLEASGIVDRRGFLDAVRDPALARLWGVPAESVDGFLFPDVYAFRRDMAPAAVVRTLVDRFYASAPVERFPARPGATRLLVRIAGLVERAPVPSKDWRLYAGLLWTRARLGQTLAPRIDGLARKDPVLFGPYRRASPTAWPPQRPNPGLEALRAAARPVQTAPRYLVRRDDGGFAYCADLDCFYEALRGT